MNFPAVPLSSVPVVDRAQMTEVDRLAESMMGLGLIQMMENAGRALAELVLTELGPSRIGSAPYRVTVLAGTGGNGGGALVAARHLTNRGCEVEVHLSRPPRTGSVPDRQRTILDAMGVTVTPRPPERADIDAVVDGIIGYSLLGPPTGPAADLIGWASARHTEGTRVVALDVPSGVDTDTGRAPGAHVSAAATLTLALPKIGLRENPAVGRLHLADISIPSAVYEQMGLDVPVLFDRGQILRLTP